MVFRRLCCCRHRSTWCWCTLTVCRGRTVPSRSSVVSPRCRTSTTPTDRTSAPSAVYHAAIALSSGSDLTGECVWIR
jgi:hypothetical protein